MLKTFITFVIVALCSVSGFPHKNISYDGRIIGGAPAPDGQYPYQISLRTPQNRHFCGGSIISPNWILTAAHCVYGKDGSSMMVVVGTNYLNNGGTAYGIQKVIWHQQYNPADNAHDVALLKLSTQIAYTAKVQPVPLASSTTPYGSSCILSGWGLTSFPSNNIPDYLYHIRLTSISLTQCQSALGEFFPIYQTHLCTLQGYGRGACQGDSGGPLVCGGQQHGVVSWGIPCAKGKPDVFTSVASYRNWIAYYTDL